MRKSLRPEISPKQFDFMIDKGTRNAIFTLTMLMGLCFFYIASPQQGDLRLSGPASGQGAGSGARTRDRRVPADLRADSQATVLPTPRQCLWKGV
ncbi:hypothetical protein PoB_004165700 [Plakobranchus ocellatus]|uniref:Uncharacterized protein n=1 Tax=Plakobranchus ocellatus TaxID=259542 RepID=A0AAV4B7T6_9GAST|nr:hypothetical protein PoB_004165700 [Plakobranchus ocellatus]